jgi:serine/threonine protein kinase
MTKTNPCPDVRNLQALLEDAAPGSDSGELLGHLETCANCQHTLESLAADPGAWDDAVEGLANGLVQETALRHMVERLQGEDFAAAVRHEITFLRPTDKPGLLGLFGPYEVLEVVGQGGMGIVFKALEPALDRVVALKVLAPRLASSATPRRRFIREGKAAAAVTHDHIVAIHGVSEAEGLPYIVMQHIIGESLQDRLDRAGPLELEEIVRIGLETAYGLAAAHAQGLIHRDIKPANLLLEFGGRVKITDFGLARMADDTLLTQDGVVTGTPEYMAPEQARGEPVDHRADLFSLGSVLYAMCTGNSPFPAPTTIAVLRQVCDENPKAVRALNPQVPLWLETLIARLMAKDPKQRYQSAAEVAALLEDKKTGKPGEKETRRWLAGHVVSISSGLLAMVAFGFGMAAWLAGGQGATDLKKETPKDGSQELIGPGADQCVKFEPEGLRITLPSNHPKGSSTGLSKKMVLKGDFEVLLDFEILKEPEAKDAGDFGTRLAMTVGLDAPKEHGIKFTRAVRTEGGSQFIAFSSQWKNASEKLEKRNMVFSTTAKKGRFRLVRQGGVLFFWVSEDADTDFKLLREYRFSDEDLKFIRIVGSTGSPTAYLDARVWDLRIKGGNDHLEAPTSPANTPLKPEPKGYLAVALLIGLTITLSLAMALWFFVRQRRGKDIPSALGSEEVAVPLSFQCPSCQKKLKAEVELAGKKIKCPQCGNAVPVP